MNLTELNKHELFKEILSILRKNRGLIQLFKNLVSIVIASH